MDREHLFSLEQRQHFTFIDLVKSAPFKGARLSQRSWSERLPKVIWDESDSVPAIAVLKRPPQKRGQVPPINVFVRRFSGGVMPTGENCNFVN
jgi:hypothetical protein